MLNHHDPCPSCFLHPKISQSPPSATEKKQTKTITKKQPATLLKSRMRWNGGKGTEKRRMSKPERLWKKRRAWVQWWRVSVQHPWRMHAIYIIVIVPNVKKNNRDHFMIMYILTLTLTPNPNPNPQTRVQGCREVKNPPIDLDSFFFAISFRWEHDLLDSQFFAPCEIGRGRERHVLRNVTDKREAWTKQENERNYESKNKKHSR